tara:strand:- start:494 stop:613 length:120 start_codon:yes stop_codon:yes gene_type:complete
MDGGLIGFQAAEIGAAICTVFCVIIISVGVILIARRFLK